MRHYPERRIRSLNSRPDTAADVADRALRAKACALTKADMEARYPTATLTDVLRAQEALDYQQARLEHHLRTLRAGGRS